MMLDRIVGFNALTPTGVVERLREHLPDQLFLKVAIATFGPAKYFLKAEKFQAFLGSKKCSVDVVEQTESLTLDWPGWTTLQAMACGDLSGDAAKLELAKTYLPLTSDDREVVLKILDKTWRYGVTVDTINAARPGTFRPAKVMLAHKLLERIEHDKKQVEKGKPATIPWPLVATVKYDGYRAEFHQGTGEALSREANPFPLQPGLLSALQTLGRAVQEAYELDYVPAFATELFNGNWRETAKARGTGYNYAVIIRPMHDDSIFGEYEGDTEIDILEFYRLLDQLIAELDLGEWLQRADFKVVETPEEEQAFFEEQIAKGLEGTICCPQVYSYESKRSYFWLKHKNNEREDLPIHGATMGDPRGKHAGLVGAVEVVRNGVVSGCHGMSDKVRAQVTELHESGQLAGLIAEVSYHELTPDGVLRHGTIKKIRFDKGVNS